MSHWGHRGWGRLPSYSMITVSLTCCRIKFTLIDIRVAARPQHPWTGQFIAPPRLERPSCMFVAIRGGIWSPIAIYIPLLLHPESVYGLPATSLPFYPHIPNNSPWLSASLGIITLPLSSDYCMPPLTGYPISGRDVIPPWLSSWNLSAVPLDQTAWSGCWTPPAAIPCLLLVICTVMSGWRPSDISGPHQEQRNGTSKLFYLFPMTADTIYITLITLHPTSSIQLFWRQDIAKFTSPMIMPQILPLKRCINGVSNEWSGFFCYNKVFP